MNMIQSVTGGSVDSHPKKCASQSPEKLTENGHFNHTDKKNQGRSSTSSLEENNNYRKNKNTNNYNNNQHQEEDSCDLFDCENPEYDGLLYKDPNNFSHTMHLLNILRKNRQLCDLILQLDDDSQEIYCHQVVLACNSKFFMEIFNSYESEQSKNSKLRLSNFDQEIPNGTTNGNQSQNNSETDATHDNSSKKIPLQDIVNKNHNSKNKQLILCLSDYLREFLSDKYQHHYAKINNIVSHNSHHHHYHHFPKNNLNHHIDGGITVVTDPNQINHAFDYEALKICIDYMYTSQLKVPSYLLPHVYTLAYHLSFDSIVQACGQYLIKHLTVDNCLSIRSFALDETLIQASSQCIEKDIEYILQLSPNPIGNSSASFNSSSSNVKSASGSLTSLANGGNNKVRQGDEEKKYASNSSLSSTLNLANIEFNHLPRINIELVGMPRTTKSSIRAIDNMNELNQLCMNWLIDELIEKKNVQLNDLCDNLNMLYMNNMDHTLHDCCDMNSSDCNFNDHIDDYQKKHSASLNNLLNTNNCNSNLNGNNNLSRKNSSRNSPTSNGGTSRIKSFKITDQELNAIGTATPIKLKLLHANEVICTHQTGENSFITICTLDGRLVSLSVHILVNNNVENNKEKSDNINGIIPNGNDKAPGYDLNIAYKSQKSNDSTFNDPNSLEHQQNHNELTRLASTTSTISTNDYEKLPKMSAARCSHGCIAYENKLYIVGGYDRGECLDLCEIYDPAINKISIFENMNNRRGRAAITWLESQSSIFCVGGSDGHEDLNSIEYFDMKKGKWTEIKFDFELGCTNLGAIACEKYVYLVGLKDRATKSLSRSSCLRYEPNTNTFHRIAPLNSGRSQSALVWVLSSLINSDQKREDNLLFVFGGYDQIKCLNSCEVYSVKDDKWTTISNMVEPRRGCGAAVHKDTHSIFIVGGTNGSQSLKSVEIYDIKTKKWTLGPELNIARTNVAIAFIGIYFFCFNQNNVTYIKS
jgi:hypothetical protein